MTPVTTRAPSAADPRRRPSRAGRPAAPAAGPRATARPLAAQPAHPGRPAVGLRRHARRAAGPQLVVGRRPVRRARARVDHDHPVLHDRASGSRRWSPSASAVLGVTIGFGGDTPWLGILPTFETGDHLNQVINTGWQSIAEQRVPATPEPGIVLLLVFLMIAQRPRRRRRGRRSSTRRPWWLRRCSRSWRCRSRCAPTSPTRSGTSSPPSCSSSSCDSAGGPPRPPSSASWARSSSAAACSRRRSCRRCEEDPGPDRRRRRDRHQPAHQPGRRPAARRPGHRADLHDDRRTPGCTCASRPSTPSTAAAGRRRSSRRTPTTSVAEFPRSDRASRDDIARDLFAADIQVGDISGRWLPLPYPSQTVTGRRRATGTGSRTASPPAAATPACAVSATT